MNNNDNNNNNSNSNVVGSASPNLSASAVLNSTSASQNNNNTINNNNNTNASVSSTIVGINTNSNTVSSTINEQQRQNILYHQQLQQQMQQHQQQEQQIPHVRKADYLKFTKVGEDAVVDFSRKKKYYWVVDSQRSLIAYFKNDLALKPKLKIDPMSVSAVRAQQSGRARDFFIVLDCRGKRGKPIQIQLSFKTRTDRDSWLNAIRTVLQIAATDRRVKDVVDLVRDRLKRASGELGFHITSDLNDLAHQEGLYTLFIDAIEAGVNLLKKAVTILAGRGMSLQLLIARAIIHVNFVFIPSEDEGENDENNNGEKNNHNNNNSTNKKEGKKSNDESSPGQVVATTTTTRTDDSYANSFQGTCYDPSAKQLEIGVDLVFSSTEAASFLSMISVQNPSTPASLAAFSFAWLANNFGNKNNSNNNSNNNNSMFMMHEDFAKHYVVKTIDVSHAISMLSSTLWRNPQFEQWLLLDGESAQAGDEISKLLRKKEKQENLKRRRRNSVKHIASDEEEDEEDDDDDDNSFYDDDDDEDEDDDDELDYGNDFDDEFEDDNDGEIVRRRPNRKNSGKRNRNKNNGNKNGNNNNDSSSAAKQDFRFSLQWSHTLHESSNSEQVERYVRQFIDAELLRSIIDMIKTVIEDEDGYTSSTAELYSLISGRDVFGTSSSTSLATTAAATTVNQSSNSNNNNNNNNSNNNNVPKFKILSASTCIRRYIRGIGIQIDGVSVEQNSPPQLSLVLSSWEEAQVTAAVAMTSRLRRAFTITNNNNNNNTNNSFGKPTKGNHARTQSFTITNNVSSGMFGPSNSTSGANFGFDRATTSNLTPQSAVSHLRDRIVDIITHARIAHMCKQTEISLSNILNLHDPVSVEWESLADSLIVVGSGNQNNNNNNNANSYSSVFVKADSVSTPNIQPLAKTEKGNDNSSNANNNSSSIGFSLQQQLQQRPSAATNINRSNNSSPDHQHGALQQSCSSPLSNERDLVPLIHTICTVLSKRYNTFLDLAHRGNKAENFRRIIRRVAIRFKNCAKVDPGLYTNPLVDHGVMQDTFYFLLDKEFSVSEYPASAPITSFSLINDNNNNNSSPIPVFLDLPLYSLLPQQTVSGGFSISNLLIWFDVFVENPANNVPFPEDDKYNNTVTFSSGGWRTSSGRQNNNNKDGKSASDHHHNSHNNNNNGKDSDADTDDDEGEDVGEMVAIGRAVETRILTLGDAVNSVYDQQGTDPQFKVSATDIQLSAKKLNDVFPGKRITNHDLSRVLAITLKKARILYANLVKFREKKFLLQLNQNNSNGHHVAFDESISGKSLRSLVNSGAMNNNNNNNNDAKNGHNNNRSGASSTSPASPLSVQNFNTTTSSEKEIELLQQYCEFTDTKDLVPKLVNALRTARMQYLLQQYENASPGNKNTGVASPPNQMKQASSSSIASPKTTTTTVIASVGFRSDRDGEKQEMHIPIVAHRNSALQHHNHHSASTAMAASTRHAPQTPGSTGAGAATAKYSASFSLPANVGENKNAAKNNNNEPFATENLTAVTSSSSPDHVNNGKSPLHAGSELTVTLSDNNKNNKKSLTITSTSNHEPTTFVNDDGDDEHDEANLRKQQEHLLFYKEFNFQEFAGLILHSLMPLEAMMTVCSRRNVLFAGLTQTGKSLLIDCMKHDFASTSLLQHEDPTIGLTTTLVPFANWVLSCKELGGREQQVSYVREFEPMLADLHGIVFVVDGARMSDRDDKNYIADVKEYLSTLMNLKKLKGLPCLLLVNNSLSPSAKSTNRVCRLIDWDKACDGGNHAERAQHRCSVITSGHHHRRGTFDGDGARQGILWLCNIMR